MASQLESGCMSISDEFNPHQTIIQDFSAQKPQSSSMRQAKQARKSNDNLSCENSTIQTIESIGETKGAQKLTDQLKHTFGETSSLAEAAG